VTLGAACLGAGVHFVNALRDLEADRGVGIAGLPQRIGIGATTLLATFTLASAGVLVAQPGLGRPPVALSLLVTLLLVIGVAVSVGRGRPWLAYRLMIAAAGAVLMTLLLSGT
jgi:1,4-dihydroxy-2-naphthoate octaprenyltransferase